LTHSAAVGLDVGEFERTAEAATASRAARIDGFAREIYGFLGVPIDATSMTSVANRIEMAASRATPLLISTANVNFLANCQRDPEFRDSLISSDICTADGMPIVWLSRLLGIPMKERVAGSDLFALLTCKRSSEPLKVFLFGGEDGVAAQAAERINAQHGGVICTGVYFPGHGSVEEMSTDVIIAGINASHADCLVVALGARKGHAWLKHNQDRLKIPIRTQLGATINFEAGTVARAPVPMQKCGLEWLWRIKEEPRLWRRYLADGLVLGRLLLTHVIPLLILAQWHRLQWHGPDDLEIERSEGNQQVSLAISGLATTENFEKAAPYLQHAAAAKKNVVIDLARTRRIDARFIGLLLVLQKRLKEQQRNMQLTSVPRRVKWQFRLNGFTFLL
jgi:N-acetylglucosaminyldiphosphoundecaprenol N-acetyl-beta-D-mannosaminyltransferase